MQSILSIFRWRFSSCVLALLCPMAFAQSSVTEAVTCCADLAKSPVRQAQMGWNRFDIGEQHPKRTFAEGSFGYVLIGIPERRTSQTLSIDLKIDRSQGFPGFPNRTYFHPAASLLDANFVEIATIPTDAIAERYEGFFGNNGYYVEPTFVLPATSTARMLLLRPSADHLSGKSLSREQCYSGAGGMKCFSAEYRAVPTGSISVRFLPVPE